MSEDEHVALDTFSPTDLADCCAAEHDNGSHEPYCVELFKRAIIDECPVSWHILHTLYYPLVRYWVGEGVATESITQDDLTQDAFTAFWRSYTADKLAQALGLGSILSYLKSCAVTARLQEIRKASSRGIELSSEEVPHLIVADALPPETIIATASNAEQLWTIVSDHCHSEAEEVIARLAFVADMKPSTIASQHPEHFQDVTDVYRIKRNLRDRLRRDPQLQAIYQNIADLHLFE